MSLTDLSQLQNSGKMAKARRATAQASIPQIIRTLRGEISSTPPVWLMRQAGRYLPEYRRTRSEAGCFLNLCFNPTLATEVTLQPLRRYDLDAAILFADILLIADALGQELTFVEGQGPKLNPPLTAPVLAQMEDVDIHPHLAPIYSSVSNIRKSLPAEKALIGFAGAPWTVASYMLSGKSVSNQSEIRRIAYQEPALVRGLITLLTNRTIEYLEHQIDAGADIIQIFDSWAGDLPIDILRDVSIDPLTHICNSLKEKFPDTPIVLFPKGVGEKIRHYATIPSCDAVSIDYSMDAHWARRELSPHCVVQGGLDPMLVVKGGDTLIKAVHEYLNIFSGAPYIFNLGHGITPNTPPEHVALLIDILRKTKH